MRRVCSLGTSFPRYTSTGTTRERLNLTKFSLRLVRKNTRNLWQIESICWCELLLKAQRPVAQAVNFCGRRSASLTLVKTLKILAKNIHWLIENG